MKTCTRCGETQPLSNFYKQKKAKDGHGYYCKDCSRAYARKKDVTGSERALKWQRENRERHLAWKRQWAKDNRGKKNAEQAAYRAGKINATPGWMTDDHWFMIKEVYALCTLRSQMTGVMHHVDHIVPLRGENVSGLHVPWNLQVLAASENCAKGNRH